jgi:CHAD domain-containing protein
VPESISLWKLRADALVRARKAVRRGDREGLHDLRVALRRLSATAGALGRRHLSKEAKTLVRSLSAHRQLEVDRALLERVGRLGFLSPDAATALAARWEKLATRGERRLARAAGDPVETLVRRLDRLARHADEDDPGPAARLERARQRAEIALGRSLDGRDDRTLHRYRIAVKKARYLAEDLGALGIRPWKTRAEREKALQEALGRWNDLRMFARRLTESRREAEERGAVTLSREIGRLLATLEPTVADARRGAVEASRALEPRAAAEDRGRAPRSVDRKPGPRARSLTH